MFKKNDPLVESVKKIMEENELRRRVEARLCEELGIASRKALPFEHHANYDALLEQRIAEEGSHPRNEKEARLAAMKHPKNKITHADVLKGRGVIDETDMSDTSKSSDTSMKQAAKPTTSSSAPSTTSSSSGRGSPRPVHLAPNAAPNYGMIQQEEDSTSKTSDMSMGQSSKPSPSPKPTPSSGPKPVHLAPNAAPNYGMIQQEEDRSSSHPDFKAPRAAGAPTYKDEIKYKEEPKTEMPKNPPMPPRRPEKLEEKIRRLMREKSDEEINSIIQGVPKGMNPPTGNKPSDSAINSIIQGTGNGSSGKDSDNEKPSKPTSSASSSNQDDEKPTPSKPSSSAPSIRPGDQTMSGQDDEDEKPTPKPTKPVAPSNRDDDDEDEEKDRRRTRPRFDIDKDFEKPEIPSSRGRELVAERRRPSNLNEKAVSKAQQKFMAMVLAKKRGEMKNASPEVEKAASSMSTKSARDFAKTKHKGLPEKKDSKND